MDFLRDELGLQDMQACWQAAQRHTHLLQAFAACMALTALFMYLLFRSASSSKLLQALRAPHTPSCAGIGNICTLPHVGQTMLQARLAVGA